MIVSTVPFKAYMFALEHGATAKTIGSIVVQAVTPKLHECRANAELWKCGRGNTIGNAANCTTVKPVNQDT